jgi:hypothetical protein
VEFSPIKIGFIADQAFPWFGRFTAEKPGSSDSYSVIQATGGEELLLSVLPDVLLLTFLLAHNSRLLGSSDGALSPVLFAHFLL